MKRRGPNTMQKPRVCFGIVAVVSASVFVVLAQCWHQNRFHAALRGEYVAYNPVALDKVVGMTGLLEQSAPSTSSVVDDADWQSGWANPWLDEAAWWDRPLLYAKGSRHWPRRLVFIKDRKATTSVSELRLSETVSRALDTLDFLKYDTATQVLTCTGRMSQSQLHDAFTASDAREYRSAVERLFYRSSGNGLAMIDDQQLTPRARAGLAEFIRSFNSNLDDKSVAVTGVMLESLQVPKDYVLCGIEHGGFVTRGTAVTIGSVLILLLAALFACVRRPKWVLRFHRGTYGLLVVVTLLLVPNLFFFGVEEDRRPVFTLNRPWQGRMAHRDHEVRSYDPLPPVVVPGSWQGRFRIDATRNTLWYRGDVLTRIEEEMLATLADSPAYRRTITDLGRETRKWTYHGDRPSMISLARLFDSVRSDKEFIDAVRKRFPILHRDLDFDWVGLHVSTEDVAVPRVASVQLALFGLVILVAVVTFTTLQAVLSVTQESVGTTVQERRTPGWVLMLLAHPIRSAKLLPVSTDRDRRLAATVLMIWSALVAGNVLLARLTYEPAYPELDGSGLIAQVLLIAWGCILGGAGLWLVVFLIGTSANWVRQRSSLIAPGETGARALIVAVVWATFITVFVIAGLLLQEAGLRHDWVPLVLMVASFAALLAAVAHVLVVVIACSRIVRTGTG